MLLGSCSAAFVFGGCGFSGGQFLFFTGWFKGQKIEPEFEFAKKVPILVLVDDPGQLMPNPAHRVTLNQFIGEELIEKKAITSVIDPKKLVRFQQTRSDFAKLGAREIGQAMGAEQVLWVSVRDFELGTDIGEQALARLTLGIRVINAAEGGEHEGKVRLWPEFGDGKIVQSDMGATDVAKASRAGGTARELCRLSATKVAKNFYEYRLDAFEEKE
jgi:hypothetical protein